MLETYFAARRSIVLAAIAVFLTSGVIVTAFYRHITTACRGVLYEVPLGELTPAERRTEIAGGDGVYIDYDRETRVSYAPGEGHGFKNVRVWMRTSDCACKGELSLHWDPTKNANHLVSATALGIYRDRASGAYVVHGVGGPDVFAFRRTDETGHVFQWRKALATNNVSVLILLGAIGSLLGAGLLLARAASYTTTMSTWRSATLRDDGLLEDATGAAIARLGRIWFRERNVIVNPSSFDGRAVYRELPILGRRDVAPGSHAQWAAGTMRQFRDARVLSALATVTTALAAFAHFFAG